MSPAGGGAAPRDGPGAPQRAHGGAQRGSRQSHEASRSAERRPDEPGSDVEAILERFLGPRDLEKPQKVLYCQRISWFSRFRKGAFNRGPKSSTSRAQMNPRRAPGVPRSGPRAPKTAPRGARSPRGTRRGPRGPKPPRRLQGALREPILASSAGPWGLIFEPSRRPFRASRAVRSTDENTGRNHWSKGLSRPLRARCAEAIVHSTT